MEVRVLEDLLVFGGLCHQLRAHWQLLRVYLLRGLALRGSGFGFGVWGLGFESWGLGLED